MGAGPGWGLAELHLSGLGSFEGRVWEPEGFRSAHTPSCAQLPDGGSSIPVGHTVGSTLLGANNRRQCGQEPTDVLSFLLHNSAIGEGLSCFADEET